MMHNRFSGALAASSSTTPYPPSLKAGGAFAPRSSGSRTTSSISKNKDIEKWSMWDDLKIILRTRVNVN
jgi:hypothetical protein